MLHSEKKHVASTRKTPLFAEAYQKNEIFSKLSANLTYAALDVKEKQEMFLKFILLNGLPFNKIQNRITVQFVRLLSFKLLLNRSTARIFCLR